MKMIRLIFAVTTALMALSATCLAQVPNPKRESQLRHIFGPHRDSVDLEQRFDDIKCALVLIEAGPRLGTGFYVNESGDVATASHVLGDRTFSRNPDATVKINFAMPSVLHLTNCKGERTEIPAKSVENNPDAWLSDVARIHTGQNTSHWLREADDKMSRPGEHLIVIGFPGLSFKALTLYEGIMSARLTTSLPTAILDTGEAIQGPTEFIRVQMPISAGLSGAPIIDDDNKAVAIVTSAGGWTQDLDHLMMAFRGGAFETPQPTPNPQQPNTITFSLNSLAVTAELAGLFHDYASPGYGDAVPLRYLQKPQQQNPPSASRDH